MLHEVHGNSKLHLLEAQEVGSCMHITVGTTVRHTYECEVKCCDLAEGAAAKQELLGIL
jgi:hypothetical protein